jgi:hypothetical protein
VAAIEPSNRRNAYGQAAAEAASSPVLAGSVSDDYPPHTTHSGLGRGDSATGFMESIVIISCSIVIDRD